MSISEQFDGDATRLVMGGREPAPGLGALRPAAAATDASPGEIQAIAGLNPIVAAAATLLAAVPRIRATVSHPDPAGLRDTLLQQIAQFESAARQRGVAQETILVARYALATIIDETVAGTPWGGTADWVRQSLLVTLHKETWGGEKFYQLLNKMAEDPARNIDLLELLYVGICLGFEGRFRVLDNGRAQLDALRERLYGIIRGTRGAHERDLSAQWRGEQVAPARSGSFLLLWGAAAAVALLLLGVYLWLSFALGASADNLAWGKIQVGKAQRPPVPAAAPVAPRLRQFLEAEIAEGLVEVSDSAAESRVTLRGKPGQEPFESGSASIRPAYQATLARVAAALNAVQGAVIITGHTDDRPIRSARFPSNASLSQERARSVQQQMAQTLKDGARMTAEGRADQEPLAPNDSDQNRARNRRVEIILRVPGASL